MLPARRRVSRISILVALVLALPLAVAGQEAPVAQAEPQDQIERVPGDFAEIVARVSPAVVAIATRQIVEPELPPGLPESLIESLREEGGIFGPHEASALASGFLVTAQGHVVTNNHVIEDATDIRVQLDDGTSLRGELVGRDPLTDLAVLKVEIPPTLIDEIVVAEWGDSDSLRPGAWTIAVGSPFGLGNTVTVGVLSARARDIRMGPLDDFLQTDAAINVGSSGGPLFNVEGEVVGVNTAIFTPTGASVGVGFAVPSRTAARVVGELMQTGEVRRGFLGLGLQDMTDAMARAFRIPVSEGALVAEIEPDSPAEAAGIERADIVLRLEDEGIENARDLSFLAAELEPGATVTLTVLRGGEEREVELTVAQRRLPPHEPLELPERDAARLGLSLRPLPGPLRDQLGVDEQGLLIEQVRPGGVGATAGLLRGDLILEVDQVPAEGADAIRDAWARARQENRPLLLRIMRDGASRFVAVEG